MARLLRQLVEKMAQARGQKMTPQRRAIIDYMQSAYHHPTADEVLQMVNSKFPMSSRATVYNTLNWLKQEGLIKEVFEAGCVRFDPNTEHHHHFVCRECGMVEDIECDLVGTVNICSLPARQKVEIFEVTLRGLCAGCQKRK